MNPLLQNHKPGYPAFVSDTGEGANRALAGVTTTTIVVPTGTTQATALPLLPGYNLVTTAAVNSGVIITAPYFAISNLVNLSGAIIKCYPPLGGKFYLTGTNIPIAIGASSITAFCTPDGITFFAITNGTVNFSGLPTSDAGLAAGDLWNNGNYVCLATGL